MTAWETPKTDWDTDDLIGDSDLNRGESNSLALCELLYPFVKGFRFYANNSIAGGGLYNIKVAGGYCTSQTSVKGLINASGQTIQKILSSSNWAAGSGTSSPCKAPGTSIGSAQWWYVFQLYNPTTSAYDIALDTSISGANISGSAIETAGYTMWKRIGAVCETSSPLAALMSTISQNQWFHVETLYSNNRYVNQSIVGIIVSTVTLANSGLSLVPPDIYPVMYLMLNFNSDNTGDEFCLWNPLYGSSYYMGIGQSFKNYVAESFNRMLYIDNNSNQINVRHISGSGSTMSVDIYVPVYYDPCETQ